MASWFLAGMVAALASGGAAAAGLTVDGAVPTPRTFDAPAFAALPRVTVTAAIHGHALACTGPWLADVLAAAGMPIGEAVKGDALTLVVVARAADGYRAAFTLGELDRTLGNAAVIVADRCDGGPLDSADGPLRLVAAADTRGARSVRQLDRLTVVALP